MAEGADPESKTEEATPRKLEEARKKGDVVAITGRLHYSSWEDRDGVTRYGCEIIADKIDFF